MANGHVLARFAPHLTVNPLPSRPGFWGPFLKEDEVMLSNKLILAGAMTLGLIGTAQAENHTIVMTGFSYFPSVTYANPGDSVTFINESGEEQTVVGKDSGWFVGPLQAEETGTLSITEETELAFYSAYCNNGNDGSDGNCGVGNDGDGSTGAGGDDAGDDMNGYGTYEDAPVKAEISFDIPPTNG